MRVKHISFLKRRGNLAHQRLEDDDSMVESFTSYDYNRECYPHNGGGRDIAKFLSKQPDVCHTNTLSTCDTRDDLESAASAQINQNSIDVISDIKITCTRSTGSADADCQNSMNQSAVTSNKCSDFYREPSWDTVTKQRAMKTSQDSIKPCAVSSSKCSDLCRETSCDTVTKQRTDTVSFDSVLDQAITALDTTFKRDNTTCTLADKKNLTIAPSSFETAEHVALLKLTKDSSFSHRAAAAMEMLKVNSYFTKPNMATSPGSAGQRFGSTSDNVISSESLAWQLSPFVEDLLPSKSQESISPMSADIVTSESLAWQMSLKTHKNTPNNTANSFGDIDIVVTESQEDENSAEPQVGKISSLLNDFSFTIKQMINTTCSDESVRSVHSFEDSLVSLEDRDDYESKNANVAAANFDVNDEVRGHSNSVVEHFAMKSAETSSKRKGNRDSSSTKSEYSSDTNSDCSDHNSTVGGFVMKIVGAATKRKNPRLSTASDYSSDSNNDASEHNSSSERFVMRADAKWKSTRDSLSIASKDSIDSAAPGTFIMKKKNRGDSLSSTSDFSVPPELVDDYDDAENNMYSSEDLESCSLISLDSSNNSEDDDISESGGSFGSKQSDELFTGNSNANRQQHTRFDFENRFSPSQETIGLEMIANPALLFKYN